MNDAIIALIRTIVPIAVGSVIAWLSLRGVNLAPETATATTTALTGLLSGAYYAVVKLLSDNFPWMGWLLGYAAQPSYTKE